MTIRTKIFPDKISVDNHWTNKLPPANSYTGFIGGVLMEKQVKQQEYVVQEVNKPTQDKSKKIIKELCKFLEKTWDMKVKTT